MKILNFTLAVAFTVSSGFSAEVIFPGGNQSLKNEVNLAIDRAAAWLVKNQEADGHWSMAEQPALSALALVALKGKETSDADRAALKKGYAFLLKNTHPDGSIHGGKGLVNYNTSIGLLALAAAKNEDYKEEILRGRRYLIGTQIDLGKKGELDTPYDGGVGYGSKGDHSDMANTVEALEALYYTKQYAADSSSKEDLNWKAAIHFLENCQNLASVNKQSWVSEDPANKGGFIYEPGGSKAGETNINGRVALRSYGSISYAGMLSYIYADLKTDDPRVQAVYDWLRRNYTLDENPGMGQSGLYYYLHTMGKALSAAGVRQLPTESGLVNWQEKLALRLIDLQRADGAWQNENGRWMEKDPVLVTAYGMITLEIISRGL